MIMASISYKYGSTITLWSQIEFHLYRLIKWKNNGFQDLVFNVKLHFKKTRIPFLPCHILIKLQLEHHLRDYNFSHEVDTQVH